MSEYLGELVGAGGVLAVAVDVDLAGAHSDGDGRHEPPSVEEIVVGDLGFHSLLIGMPPVT